MTLIEIIFKKFVDWSRSPLYIFGSIFAIIVIAVIIYFRNNKTNLFDHRQRKCIENLSDEDSDDFIERNLKFAYKGMSDKKSTSEIMSMKQPCMSITQPSIDLNIFVPYKYLCSCKHENVYAARKPIGL